MRSIRVTYRSLREVAERAQGDDERGDVYNLRFTPWRTIVAAFYTTIKVSSTAHTVRVPVMSLYNPEERKRPRTWATSACAISSFSRKRARFGKQNFRNSSSARTTHYMTREMQSPIYFTSSSDVTSIVWLDFFVYFSLSLLYLSFSLYLILSKTKLSSSKVREKHRSCVRNDYYDEAFRGHERTNATPRRWGVAVVAVWLARLTITPFHPRSRAPRSPLPAGSLSPSSALSLASLGHPCMCVPASLSLSLSLYQWIHPHSFPVFLSYRVLSIYLIPCVMCFSSSSLEIFCASLSIFSPSFFLLTLSFYLPLSTSISLFLFVALSRFSLLALSRVSFCPSATLQTLAKRAVTWTSARPIVRRVTSSA